MSLPEVRSLPSLFLEPVPQLSHIGHPFEPGAGGWGLGVGGSVTVDWGVQSNKENVRNGTTSRVEIARMLQTAKPRRIQNAPANARECPRTHRHHSSKLRSTSSKYRSKLQGSQPQEAEEGSQHCRQTD